MAPNSVRPDINVTPLIDILLVMLVIFLAAVTVTQQGIDSQIPKLQSDAGQHSDNQIVVEMSANRALAVNHQAVTLAQLEPFLRTVYQNRTDKTLYVSAAGTLPYGAVVDVMDAAKGASIQRLGVITDGMRQRAAVR